MAQHLDLGRKGESLAKAHLENAGYEILDENWTHDRAEIDLIAYVGEPEDFVDARKQKLLIKAADQYIYLMNHQGEVRFDIIAILFDKQANYTLKHIEDAFWPSTT
jgi:putative endonuclease